MQEWAIPDSSVCVNLVLFCQTFGNAVHLCTKISHLCFYIIIFQCVVSWTYIKRHSGPQVMSVMTITTLIKKMSAILFFPLHWSDIIDMLTEQIYIWIGARVINNLGAYCGRLMPAACCRLRFMCLPSDESCTGHGRLMFHNSVLVPQLLGPNTHMCAWIIPTRT